MLVCVWRRQTIFTLNYFELAHNNWQSNCCTDLYIYSFIVAVNNIIFIFGHKSVEKFIWIMFTLNATVNETKRKRKNISRKREEEYISRLRSIFFNWIQNPNTQNTEKEREKKLTTIYLLPFFFLIFLTLSTHLWLILLLFMDFLLQNSHFNQLLHFVRIILMFGKKIMNVMQWFWHTHSLIRYNDTMANNCVCLFNVAKKHTHTHTINQYHVKLQMELFGENKNGFCCWHFSDWVLHIHSINVCICFI